ncbi:MAG: hypothetical protein NVS2B12_11230 [Ktedonobacteraceae bacterium]
MGDKDWYEILQIHQSADPEIIDVAYRKLAQKYHPDVNKSADAEQRMKQLNEAYSVLKDPKKRAEYDKQRAFYTSSGPTHSQTTTFITKESVLTFFCDALNGEADYQRAFRAMSSTYQDTHSWTALRTQLQSIGSSGIDNTRTCRPDPRYNSFRFSWFSNKFQYNPIIGFGNNLGTDSQEFHISWLKEKNGEWRINEIDRSDFPQGEPALDNRSSSTPTYQEQYNAIQRFCTALWTYDFNFAYKQLMSTAYQRLHSIQNFAEDIEKISPRRYGMMMGATIDPNIEECIVGKLPVYLGKVYWSVANTSEKVPASIVVVKEQGLWKISSLHGNIYENLPTTGTTQNRWSSNSGQSNTSNSSPAATTIHFVLSEQEKIIVHSFVNEFCFAAMSVFRPQFRPFYETYMSSSYRRKHSEGACFKEIWNMQPEHVLPPHTSYSIMYITAREGSSTPACIALISWSGLKRGKYRTMEQKLLVVKESDQWTIESLQVK